MATKTKCPMGMIWDPSSKKCVKPGTGDTPLDKLKKEKARMLKTKFKFEFSFKHPCFFFF